MSQTQSLLERRQELRIVINQINTRLGMTMRVLGRNDLSVNLTQDGMYAYAQVRGQPFSGPTVVQLSDLAALIGVIGGSAVLALFDREGGLFGAYGIGLAIGFFSYFLSLIVMVSRSDNFNIDWFLDGRRRKPSSDYVIPPGTAVTVTPMNAGDGSGGKVPPD